MALQIIKGIEKLRLRAVLSYNKLYVVNQEDVNVPILILQLRLGFVPDGIDHFICEGLARHIQELQIRMMF